MRHYSKTDQFCLGFDQVLKTIFGKPETTGRPYPATFHHESLTREQNQHSAGLMRVNHAGEVCAQALYHGQGLISKNPAIKEKMKQAKIEEGDHLAWCSQRLMELGSHTSYLNPVWYAGSFAIGVAAGLVGDRWSLGFLAETETQVVKHLEHHLTLLPAQDKKSHQILQQMQKDEAHHHEEAMMAGAVLLPWPIKKMMEWTSKVMVKVAYWL